MNTLISPRLNALRTTGLTLAYLLCLQVSVTFGQSACSSCASRVDWTTMASKYTHDPSGQRIDQYAKGVEPFANDRSDFERSGYRHYRSTLQAGNSADNLHIVESWGKPVRPYEEWRFPYRPYSVPYDQWGPQPPAVGVFPFGGGFSGPGPIPYGPNPYGPNPYGPTPYPQAPNGMGPGGMGPGGTGAPSGPGFQNGNGFQNGAYPGVGPYPPYGRGYPSPYVPDANAPWTNGYWPTPREPMMSDREFFQVPRQP